MSGYGILDGTNSGVSSDLFMRNVDYFDFPMESLEGDDLNGGYWDAKLQSLVPILSEVLAGSSLPSGGYIGRAASVVAPSLSDPSKEPELKCVPNSVEEAAREGISHQNNYAGGPVSVHGNRSSCSSEKRLPTISEIFPCSKRSRFSTTYLHHSSASKEFPLSSGFSESNPPKTKTNPVRRRKKKKKKKLAQLSGAATQRMQRFVESKKCLHCQVSETPQWRDGPMGRKTLCNACGVRYRLGRLFVEYRPAASPTFVPSLHSNIHKQVIEMREKVQDLVPTLVCSSLASGGNAASVVDEESSEVKLKPNVVKENSRSSSSPDDNYSVGLDSGVLQTPSPVSAHKSSSSSCSSEPCVSLTSGMVTRSMRSRLSTTNPHCFEEVSRSKGVSESNLMNTMESPVKRKLKLHFKLLQQSGATETRKCSHCETKNTPQRRNGPTVPSTTNPHRFEELSRSNGVSEYNLLNTKENPVKRKLKLQFKLPQQSGATETRKCSHCETNRTPQWRNGPTGPKTLCNACGVRYMQGRLFPEYRPAGSPAFVPSLHSSSHKVVVQMRERAIREAETEPPTSPLPKLEASEQ